VAGKKPTLESLLALLLSKGQRFAKLKQIAERLRRRSGYEPVACAEHCPACWVSTGTVNRLRTEPHHNALSVFAVVCDACGFYLVL
jgi:hypothetical protein